MALNMTAEFICCVKHHALKTDNFKSREHLFNLTIPCSDSQANDRINFILFLKKVIKSLKAENVACEVSTICHEKTRGWFNVYVLLLIIMMIFGLVGNFLVCFVFWKCKKLRMNVNNYFIASLAVADLLVVFVTLPISIIHALHNQYFCAPIEVCRLHAISDRIFFVASIMNILALTVDRYLSIAKPYNARRIMSPIRAKILITLIWLYAIFWGIMINVNFDTKRLDSIFISSDKQCVRNENSIYYWVEYSVVFFIPIVVMFIVYVLIYRISISHAKMIDNNLRRMSSTTQPRKTSTSSTSGRNSISRIGFILTQSATSFANNRRSEARTTRVLVLVYGTFVVCWLPIVIISYWTTINITLKRRPQIHRAVYAIFCEILPLLNSILNPFIYGILHKEFKASLKKIFGITHLQNQRRGSNGSGGQNKNLDMFTKTIHTRFPSISISTARSNSEFNQIEGSTATAEAPHNFENNKPMKSECYLSPEYPVYRIPNDFYPVSEIPEHDKSMSVTPEGCRNDNFLLYKGYNSKNNFEGIENDLEEIETNEKTYLKVPSS